MKGLVDNLYIDNCDFACNMLAFLANITKGEGLHELLEVCIQKVLTLEGGQAPQIYFMKHFSNNYKPADAPDANKEEVEESDDEDMEDEVVKEDHVASSTEFRSWRSLCKANAVLLTLISDFASSKQDQDEDDDEEIEEVDDVEFAEEEKTSESSNNGLLLRHFDMCLARCQAVPQYLGLT